MRLIHASDIHFGSEDPAAIKAATDYIKDSDADALIISGDVTQRGKRIEFEAAKRWLGQFSIPTLCVPGNHDTPLLNLQHRLSSPFKRYHDFLSDYDGPLTVSGWTFLGLNTARGAQARANWAEGAVNLSHIQQLSDAPRKSVLVCHHPFVSPPKTPLRTRTRNGKAADLLLQQSPVQLLLAGHVHAPTLNVRGSGNASYLSITAGTLSTRLRGERPALNVIDLTDDHISATAIFLQAAHQTRTLLGRHAWL
jgi:3',5'-cyclic AMP phosphodiesterase CpdA